MIGAPGPENLVAMEAGEQRLARSRPGEGGLGLFAILRAALAKRRSKMHAPEPAAGESDAHDPNA